jgi:hypothetical protein
MGGIGLRKPTRWCGVAEEAGFEEISALEEYVISPTRNIANVRSEDHALKGLVTVGRIARVTHGD